MSPKKRIKFPSLWEGIVWIFLALLCIQGFLFFQKKGLLHQEKKPEVVRPIKETPKTVKKITPVKKTTPIKKSSEVLGHICIVIDDWGYNKTHCRELAELPGPAGIAILPNLPYSRDIIACAKAAGKEPMLHLPLEPHNRKEIFDDGYVLTTDMSIPDLKKVLFKIIKEMNGVVGINNHTGSKGSESFDIMNLVLSESKRRGLFYLDSVTSHKTVAGTVASQLNMRIAKRDVFLDNQNDRVSIEKQFDQLTVLARKNGYALAIGHDRALSLKIIAEQMKKLSDQGYKFISVGEYIKNYEYPRH